MRQEGEAGKANVMTFRLLACSEYLRLARLGMECETNHIFVGGSWLTYHEHPDGIVGMNSSQPEEVKIFGTVRLFKINSAIR
jgi:hypothetical protein